MRWAFAENPTEMLDIICHVLPTCLFDLILGQDFLRATETLSIHRRRFTECSFKIVGSMHLSYVDGCSQYFRGMLAGDMALAIPDTGADVNVMSLGYALRLGFLVNRESRNRGYLIFADGTSQYTVGQVDTTWTFETSEKVPVTFEVLEGCSADVILGEELLWDYNVFEKHIDSLVDLDRCQDGSNTGQPHDLAPFTFVKRWQQKIDDLLMKMRPVPRYVLPETTPPSHMLGGLDDASHTLAELDERETAERKRRDEWNFHFGFEGEKASEVEKETEQRRRQEYQMKKLALEESYRISTKNASRVPSIPTAPRPGQRPPDFPEEASHQQLGTTHCINLDSRSNPP